MRHLLLEAKSTSSQMVSRNLTETSRESNSNAPAATVHIGDLIREKEKKKEFYHSFELVSQKGGEKAYESFFKDMESGCKPLFFTLTWHNQSGENFLPLQLVSEFPKNTLLHLSAKGLSRTDVERILPKVLEMGITNLLVVRGDDPSNDGDFLYAVDLIEFIKTRYNDEFCIAVAGYPDTHPQSPSKESDLYYLKKKVDAGASFVITQISFESRQFIEFVKDCRSCGVDVPIIPGIFPISNYKTLMNLQKICSLKIPQEIHQDLMEIKDNDQELRNYGINLATRITSEIFSSGVVHGYHLFTLNDFSIAQEICGRLSAITRN
ncbi:methylenetetrahydrofolate reductase isoform X2 [Fopius arisanus]|nr:PREDICTED: methylenetetrahydrofolate reductase isoform X2 [Fopius arisanus]XP_011310538.1 PREDICTED: methylenetetrahydrofolate reductase isoform X2 [Fopius arisanus]